MRGRPSSRSSRISQSCKDDEREDVDSGPVRHQIAPMVAARRVERRPDDLEVFGAVGIGADEQRRSAIERRMMIDVVLHTGFARRDQRGRGIRGGEIEKVDFGGLVIVR